jgi:hypothetical protein
MNKHFQYSLKCDRIFTLHVLVCDILSLCRLHWHFSATIRNPKSDFHVFVWIAVDTVSNCSIQNSWVICRSVLVLFHFLLSTPSYSVYDTFRYQLNIALWYFTNYVCFHVNKTHGMDDHVIMSLYWEMWLSATFQLLHSAGRLFNLDAMQECKQSIPYVVTQSL